MRRKDVISFAFESFLNKTISFSGQKKGLLEIDYLRQVNRLYSNIESTSIKYLIDKYKFDYIIDIGANRGQYYQYLRNVAGYKGKVISVEPLPDEFEYLQKSGKDDKNFNALNVACGETNGKAILNIARDSKLSSLYQGSEFSNERFEDKISYFKKVEVNVQSLEHILSALDIDTNSNLFVKVDTQGHDTYVIKGLGSWMKNVQAIQSELSLIAVYEGISTYKEAIATLEEFGFNLFSCVPVTRDKNANSIVEMNGFFVKRAGIK